MITAIQFGGFTLDSNNGVSVNVIRERSGPQRATSLAIPARDRGVSVLDITPQSKIIEIEGTLSHPNASLGSFQTRIQDFNAATQQQADLILTTPLGIFMYEDCVLMNSDSVLIQESHWNIDYMKFRLEFLAPKGHAISSELTENSFVGISTSPYSNEIAVGGSLRPDGVITLSLDSTGGNSLNNIVFLNKTTNESIAVGTSEFASNDVIVINNKTKQVTYNSRAKIFSGILPSFLTGTNKWKVTVESGSSLHASQTASNSERNVYGANYLSQQINPDGNISLAQIDLSIKRIEGSIDSTILLDDFSDSSISSEWTVANGVTESGGKLNIGDGGTNPSGNATAQSTTTSNKGWIWTWGVVNRGTGGDPSLYTEITDGSKYIRFTNRNDVQRYDISTSGFGGESITDLTTYGEIKVLQEGNDIKVYVGGSVVLTIAGQSMTSMTIKGLSNQNTNQQQTWDNVKYITATSSNANDDLIVEIQTDSGGLPSGSVVSGAQTTISQSDISSSSFNVVPIKFNSISLTSATDYHIVARQANDGGDANNYYSVKVNTGGGYSQGSVATSNNSGSSWTEQTDDLYFKVYDAFATGFDLDVNIDYYVTHHAVG